MPEYGITVPIGKSPGDLQGQFAVASVAQPHHAAGLDVHPGGSEIAVGLQDGTVRLLLGKRGRRCAEIGILRAHKGKILAVAYHPDGNFLVSASADKTLIVWKYETDPDATEVEDEPAIHGGNPDDLPQPAVALRGHSLAVSDCAADGNLV